MHSASTDSRRALGDVTEAARRATAAGRHGEAAALLAEAVRTQPDAALFNQLAHALKALRQRPEAEQALRRAIVLEPGHADALVSYGNLRMMAGDLPAAFRFQRRRHDQPGFPWRRRRLPMPTWRGEPLAGRRLLVHAERDFGDTLQFMMFVPRLAGLGGHVILEVQPEMRRLAASLAGVDTLLSHGEPLPEADLHIALPDLPEALGIIAADLPPPAPYLTAPPQRRLGERIDGELRLGVVWSGRRGDTLRDVRHCAAGDLAPLAAIPGVRLFSLQTGPAADEFAALAACCPVTDLAGGISDFADTAALLMEMDALVSVDTAVVHLAGALGRRVFLLHHAAPAVRWHFHALHRPWYRTLTLVPPGRGESWRDITARLAGLLPAMLRHPVIPVLPPEARLK